MSQIRLNKLLSQAGVASRRLSDELISQGRVEVNGSVVSELGAKADPDVDDVRVDGRRLKLDTARRYLLLNKPRGVMSTRSDPHNRRTVVDLLVAAGIRGYFYPVGRLDFDSEGLLLMTNDGDFAQRVTHPRYELERTYEALVEGIPDDRDLERLRTGVVVDGRRTLPAAVRILRIVAGRKGDQAVVELVLREGRNRQVRHMCDAIAHPVDRLRRVRIGGVSDRQLRLGDLRDLTPAEVRSLVRDPKEPREPRVRKPHKPGSRERAAARAAAAGLPPPARPAKSRPGASRPAGSRPSGARPAGSRPSGPSGSRPGASSRPASSRPPSSRPPSSRPPSSRPASKPRGERTPRRPGPRSR